MDFLDEKIKKKLAEYESLKRGGSAKLISKQEYYDGKKKISSELNKLLDSKIKNLEKQKESETFRLHNLEGDFTEGNVDEAAYHDEHVGLQEALADITRELTALKAGKNNIDNLDVIDKPKVVVLRKHAVVSVIAVFFLIVFYVTYVLGVDLHFTEMILDFVKKPFEKPDKENMLSSARKFAVRMFSGQETLVGFGAVKPLPGTTVSPSGDIHIDFIKPNLKMIVVSAQAFNAENSRKCSGDVMVSGENLTDVGVEISQGAKSFIVEFKGCPPMTVVDSDYLRIGVELSYKNFVGESFAKHTLRGEINLN
ncbi:MAG: hypothetical protein ABH851_05260 [Methanobacteriota archaeon]